MADEFSRWRHCSDRVHMLGLSRQLLTQASMLTSVYSGVGKTQPSGSHRPSDSPLKHQGWHSGGEVSWRRSMLHRRPHMRYRSDSSAAGVEWHGLQVHLNDFLVEASPELKVTSVPVAT